MNRRQFLGSAAAVSLASAASFARAHGHADYHHHHDMQPAAASAYTAVRQTAAHCLDAGQVCLTHCLSLLTQGDTSMSDCAIAVRQMLALCGAVHDLAAQNSPLTRDAAKVCLEACKQCAKACKEHAAHHAECKACYESCLDCIKECEKLAA
ncbi:TPA: four-helix bundle copper-binding protein [Neisseria gonorrhoeae]|uniref:four-helix bundle copper-binding protein n=1 Tax=Neisseria gonorrhoeae TaxID=485 RepID=UPI001133CE5B|nr:four-helix bundle copper-binding protein [Neisseria gonorrhoeae]TJW94299.1 four-helix bundle copper-binding protein [Neisseria gonorrhoeae]